MEGGGMKVGRRFKLDRSQEYVIGTSVVIGHLLFLYFYFISAYTV